MARERDQAITREKGKAVVRGLHLSELGAAGEARAQALKAAEDQLDRIARLMPDALAAGLSMVDIARVTNVSRTTLYEVRARYGGSASDLRLAVLQAVALGHAENVTELADRLGRPEKEVSWVVDGLVDANLFFREPEQVGPDEWEERLHVTGAGVTALEDWTFENDLEEERG